MVIEAIIIFNSIGADYELMTAAILACQEMILSCNNNDTLNNCDGAVEYCEFTQLILVTSTGINPYNLDDCTVKPLCYNFTNVGVWLNNDAVRAQLGVDKKCQDCATLVDEFVASQWGKEIKMN